MKNVLRIWLCLVPGFLIASQDDALTINKLAQDCANFRVHVTATFVVLDQRVIDLIGRIDSLERKVGILQQRGLLSGSLQAYRRKEIEGAQAAGVSLRQYRVNNY